MDSNEMFGVQYAVFVLAGCINYLGRIILAIVFNDPTKGVFDCRVVALDKVMLNKPNGKGGFPYGSIAHDGYLSLFWCTGHYCGTVVMITMAERDNNLRGICGGEALSKAGRNHGERMVEH
jgi:hypothetical protein